MSDLGAVGGVEGWLKSADRKLRSLEQSIMKARIPRSCTSNTRPNPARIQPGVSLFETDTGRTIYVNATQTGWVNARGQVEEILPAIPTLAAVTGNPTVPQSAFTTLPLTRPGGATDPYWNASSQYVAPRAGDYLITGYLRVADQNAGPRNVGLQLNGADTNTAWLTLPPQAQSTTANRFTLLNQHLKLGVTKGTTFSLSVYSDGGSVVVGNAELRVVPL